MFNTVGKKITTTSDDSTVSVMSLGRITPSCKPTEEIQRVSNSTRNGNAIGSETGDDSNEMNDVTTEDMSTGNGLVLSNIETNKNDCSKDDQGDQKGEMENISFRNSYYRDLLKEEDDSFEMLPSVNDDEVFVSIENTMNESETDYIDGRNITDDKTNSSKISRNNDDKTKRRCISVDNSVLRSNKGDYRDQPRIIVSSDSKETIILHKVDNTILNIQKSESMISSRPMRRSRSMSDILSDDKRKGVSRKKTFSSKLFRSGSVSNIMEDDFLEDKVKCLSHKHWLIVLNNPGQWFYCWHPLLGVKSLLK